MCLAVPGKVLSVEGEDPAFRSARVDFCGVRKTVSLAFTPEVQLNDLPAEVIVFGVQPMSTEWSVELSPPVEKALGPLIDSVVARLEA
jgi:hydrogenase expression/formation protein HypC